MKRRVLAGLLSAAMVATTVFASVGVWAAEDAAEEDAAPPQAVSIAAAVTVLTAARAL